MLDHLRKGLQEAQKDFDVVILDPPPALGMISISALQAANALLVPVPPSVIDFSSTCQFFSMLRDSMEVLQEHGMGERYKFLKVVTTKSNDSKSAHVAISEMMRDILGDSMLSKPLKDSAEIDNANGSLMTVYELEGPTTSRETHQRCRAYLDGVCGEIELLIRKTWPSHREALQQQGLI